MQRIFNKDNFNWWIGVVEDRFDPLMLGRCRVRIFGYHTDSKELLKTEDLPWCIPIQPITSTALSGLGTTPLGPIEGTWVIGFFIDGEDQQQPAMFGTIAATVAQETFYSSPEKPPLINPTEPIKKDPISDTPLVDDQGNPIPAPVPNVPGWSLGQTSEKYESGGNGPGTINDYLGKACGDLGGASYGTYQFASFLPPIMCDGRARPTPKNSPVLQFIANSKFRKELGDLELEPATGAFDSAWKAVAAANPKEFKQDQHDYIQRKYYNVMIANLQRAGYDMTRYGPAVQDLVWSTAVQLGPARVSVFTTPLLEKSELTDRDIVTLVSDYKIANVDIFFKSSSPAIRAGVRSRWVSEKADLLKLVKS